VSNPLRLQRLQNARIGSEAGSSLESPGKESPEGDPRGVADNIPKREASPDGKCAESCVTKRDEPGEVPELADLDEHGQSQCKKSALRQWPARSCATDQAEDKQRPEAIAKCRAKRIKVPFQGARGKS
jgi:hypothetical protein